jgi:hypothetical protein
MLLSNAEMQNLEPRNSSNIPSLCIPPYRASPPSQSKTLPENNPNHYLPTITTAKTDAALVRKKGMDWQLVLLVKHTERYTDLLNQQLVQKHHHDSANKVEQMPADD